jgi:hypothetical protein
LFVGLDAGAGHLETTALVEEEAANTDVDRLTALAACGEDVRRHGRLGANDGTTEAQRHREEENGGVSHDQCYHRHKKHKKAQKAVKSRSWTFVVSLFRAFVMLFASFCVFCGDRTAG